MGGFMPSNAAVARRRCILAAPVERACAALLGDRWNAAADVMVCLQGTVRHACG